MRGAARCALRGLRCARSAALRGAPLRSARHSAADAARADAATLLAQLREATASSPPAAAAATSPVAADVAALRDGLDAEAARTGRAEAGLAALSARTCQDTVPDCDQNFMRVDSIIDSN